MKVTLVSPHLVMSNRDLFTTGIVYMPIALSYLSAMLEKESISHQVIDVFGEDPHHYAKKDYLLFRGMDISEFEKRISKSSDKSIFVVYAINIAAHDSFELICRTIKASHPNAMIVALENSQAVTAYSLKDIQSEMHALGVDYIATGDIEISSLRLIRTLLAGDTVTEIDGIGFQDQTTGQPKFTPQKTKNAAMDDLPFPAWHNFPLKNYWSLKYAHGPMETDRYLPLLTSRGCPYQCRFCVIPGTNDLKWRSRSPANIIAEMDYFSKKYGVTEFHIEDVDPTVNDNRTKEFCKLLIEKGSPYIWKICSGTKVETMKSEETVELMAKAGCNYISISPETGSPKVLKMINKPFNLEHAEKLIKKMNENGIYSQACFVLGFPGEEPEDLEMTRQMILRLTKNGLSEVAQFIITPVPGSTLYGKIHGHKTFSELNFSPIWREDYEYLNKFRIKMYRTFLIYKFIYNFKSFVVQPFRFVSRNFKTKMEMTPYRALTVFFKLKMANIKSIPAKATS